MATTITVTANSHDVEMVETYQAAGTPEGIVTQLEKDVPKQVKIESGASVSFREIAKSAA